MLRDLPPLPLLQFYATSSYACSYLPQRMARSQVCTPTHLIDAGVYSELVKAGFRRSGVFTYRPWCDACRECQPLRVDVAAFSPNRSQSRAWRRHLALEARERPLLFDEEHYALYLRYQTERHQDGGMDNDSREQYAHFLLQTHVDTRLVEFREAGQLRMVCIIDVLNDGLSSMYTFYDADILAASFGVFAVLWQIDLCRRLDLPWLYLGYWIRGSNKMSYKALYRPAQVLAADGWRTLSPVEKRRR